MRFAGFTLAALLLAATVGLAQPPAGSGQPIPGQPVPGQPITGHPVPQPAAPKADPQLDPHLVAWEKKMKSAINMRTDIALKRTDAVYKKDTNYSGSVLCMKPKYAVLRLDNTDDKTKVDYEAYICDGKSVYAYNGAQRTITQIPLPQNQAGVDNLMLDFLAGMDAREVKVRFDISLFKTDEHYIYLDIKPLRPNDQREFQQMRLALYGPGAATAKVAYLPAQVYMLKPGGDTEVWKFTDPKVDITGITEANFQFVPIKGWEVKRAPLAGAPVPAGGQVPNGGMVRPGAPGPGAPKQ